MSPVGPERRFAATQRSGSCLGYSGRDMHAGASRVRRGRRAPGPPATPDQHSADRDGDRLLLRLALKLVLGPPDVRADGGHAEPGALGDLFRAGPVGKLGKHAELARAKSSLPPFQRRDGTSASIRNAACMAAKCKQQRTDSDSFKTFADE